MYLTKNLEYLEKRFPKATETAKKLSLYLDVNNINLAENLTEYELEKVFTSLVNDYIKYTIDPDSLSDLCEKLYVVSEDFENLKNSRTASFLLQVADLEIYLREDFSKIEGLLKEIVKRSLLSP